MRKVFSLFLFLVALPAWACRLKQEVVSLSSPITGVLRELNLLKDPKLKAVSLFHPLTATEYGGTRLGGGLFLSKREMTKYQQSLVYFDQSAELARRLKGLPFHRTQEVRTRNADPFVITEAALSLLSSELEQCEVAIAQFREWLKSEKQFLQNRAAFSTETYFFLGEIRPEKWPSLMIVKDGPMLFWINEGKLRTLNSSLSYVTWGEKWKQSLKGKERLVGLHQTKSETSFKLVKLSETEFNVEDPMVLTPGPWQIHFMRKFVEQFP